MCVCASSCYSAKRAQNRIIVGWRVGSKRRSSEYVTEMVIANATAALGLTRSVCHIIMIIIREEMKNKHCCRVAAQCSATDGVFVCRTYNGGYGL